ncbi:hypothetical protein MJO10_32725, partial [Salmonella enterica subsp. enterica serovar Anatum]|nr:hypothetical protein [Salmonella enterica subsp. enterica serovar Anatum]
HGTDYGRVLAAFELGDHEPDFETRLHELGYECHDESNNPAFRPGNRQRGRTCIKVDTAFWLYQAGGQFANRRFLRRRQFGFDLM